MRKAVVGCAFAALLAVGTASAQDFPSRHVTLVVPLATGGSTDTIGRIIAEGMRQHLGQTVIVENTPGAGGATGVLRVSRSAPDGYTLQIGQWGTNVASGVVHDLPIDLLKDLEPVALISTQPSLIVGRKDLPPKDFKELVAWLKANPDKATAGTGGVGAPGHISGIFFQKLTDTRFQFVPYRGTAPAMRDLLAGQIDIMLDQASNVLPQLRAGTIKAFAVTAKERLASAPEVPTVDEAGLPGLHVSVWHGLWAPKGTAPDIIATLNAAVVKSLAEPNTKEKLAALGQDIPPADQLTPQALGAWQKAEIEKWWPIVKAAGIKAE
jgi:tripartite-type tricarboxylate transporter receptor subunit TctC